MPGPLDPELAADGRPIYTAIVKPDDGGGFLLLVLIDDDEERPEQRVWASGTFSCPNARALTAEIALGMQVVAEG
ncbi:MAG TPA: hypothetical protein VF628_11270 [Allosphingosinicella sp.]|jgi:hypothetical protein